ncbi:hypothetical protein PUNSTDRAFT_128608 [Punctularia strigosozonata HHB-11173 SS5]|uniref:Uncharacterized protein n=1 Tax=Punctularia strigosozonata (strain HHB-11173) TaxID=741275 RepID=R7S254_PUNST|nr:uncharacterized protein PUNSTDRAFT_128608 [Punctularia strigosozonata HHB-11173 SS5]EIN03862.1 hypothetical protein PUNSTDRAFT_128608 [Punctularia strigosozonata HHB-11173 SS5]
MIPNDPFDPLTMQLLIQRTPAGAQPTRVHAIPVGLSGRSDAGRENRRLGGDPPFVAIPEPDLALPPGLNLLDTRQFGENDVPWSQSHPYSTAQINSFPGTGYVAPPAGFDFQPRNPPLPYPNHGTQGSAYGGSSRGSFRPRLQVSNPRVTQVSSENRFASRPAYAGADLEPSSYASSTSPALGGVPPTHRASTSDGVTSLACIDPRLLERTSSSPPAYSAQYANASDPASLQATGSKRVEYNGAGPSNGTLAMDHFVGCAPGFGIGTSNSFKGVSGKIIKASRKAFPLIRRGNTSYPPAAEYVDDGVAKYACPECLEHHHLHAYLRRKEYYRHYRDHHEGKSRLRCPARGCNQTFPPARAYQLGNHVRDKHEDACSVLSSEATVSPVNDENGANYVAFPFGKD